MKQFILLILIGLYVGCTTAKKISALNDSWVPVKQEMNGKELPTVAFAGQKLIMNDSNYTFTAESVDKGIVKYNKGKMDIYGREGVNSGKHFTAIYKYENGQLFICYNLMGNGYPEAFDTRGKPMYFLTVYKREAGK